MFEHLGYCDLVEAEVGRLADAVASSDLSRVVPSCPDWTVRKLADHCGSTLLWGAELVRRRSQSRLSGRDLALAPPEGRSGDPDWLRECGATLLTAMRAADPDAAMWAWGADQHVRFWSRRMLHEILVHRVDVVLSGALPVAVDPVIAADCVDELLVNLRAAAAFSPRVLEIKGGGEVIELACTDTAGKWLVRLETDGFAVGTHVSADATVRAAGPAQDLMLLLNRRAPLADVRVDVSGDEGVLAFWLERSAFQ